jgi:hypothetical protein
MHLILSWRRQDPSIERATRSASCRAFVWSEPSIVRMLTQKQACFIGQDIAGGSPSTAHDHETSR